VGPCPWSPGLSSRPWALEATEGDW
jgi:hypothetical protein